MRAPQPPATSYPMQEKPSAGKAELAAIRSLAVEGARGFRFPIHAELTREPTGSRKSEIGVVAVPVDRPDHLGIAGRRDLGRSGMLINGSVPFGLEGFGLRSPGVGSLPSFQRRLEVFDAGQRVTYHRHGAVFVGIVPRGVERNQTHLLVAEPGPG